MSEGTGRYSLKIKQGATLRLPMTWKVGKPLVPVNVSGYSARLQVRAKSDASEVLLDMNTTNGRITVGGIDGKITLLLSATETRDLTWRKGVYDLEVVSPDGVTVRRLLEGNVEVSREVTR